MKRCKKLHFFRPFEENGAVKAPRGAKHVTRKRNEQKLRKLRSLAGSGDCKFGRIALSVDAEAPRIRNRGPQTGPERGAEGRNTNATANNGYE